MDDLMHFMHISIILDLKICKRMFKILNKICSLLKCFCQIFVLYLWIYYTSFLKQFISARICFLEVTTRLVAN